MKWPWSKAERRDADPSWAALVNGGMVSTSGQFVSERVAESLTAVFSAVQALSESVSTLPLHCYARLPDGQRERADDIALARVLRQPNEWQTGVQFREGLTAAVLLSGNGYARIDRDASGEVTALHPLPTREVSVIRLPSGRWVYEFNGQRLLAEEVFHLADRTEPGQIVGRSRIAIAREQIGLALALREHGSRTFSNSARLSGVLQTSGILTAEQVTRLGESWRSQYSGVDNAGRTAVLEGGLSFTPLSMNLEDAQWLQAQQFGVVEVARLFRVPPTMLQDLSHASYSNTAELGSQFVRYSLQRWLTMWEAEITRQLLGPIARGRYHAEHAVEGLLRGNPEGRADFYTKAIASGWMTVDEVRALENLPKRGPDNAAEQT